MKVLLLILAGFIFTPYALSGQVNLSVGDRAPEFKAIADNGSTWDIKDFIGKKYVVVYFYPGAMTSGCTKQACSYRDHRDDLQAAGVEVIGISGDKVDNLKLFKQAENLNFTLLSEEKGKIAKAFGVPVGGGSSFKKTIDGTEHEIIRDISEKRWTFIIGKNGKIIYKNESVDPEKDSGEVLKFIKLQSAS
jgi:peroxiredoxin Q/BCP